MEYGAHVVLIEKAVRASLHRGSAIPVQQAALRVIGRLVVYVKLDDDLVTSFITLLAEALSETTVEVKVTALQGIAFVAKKNHASIVKQLPRLLPLVLPLARERKLVRVKYAGERALLYLLRYKHGESILKKYCKVIDAQNASDLTDYCARVLGQLPESEDEN